MNIYYFHIMIYIYFYKNFYKYLKPQNLYFLRAIISYYKKQCKNYQYANYYQFYQGTFIPNTGYLCHFDNNDKLTKIEGVFAPIEGLNITPSISSDEADSIFSRFLNKKIKGSMLQITPFYKDGNIDVRLTYIINDYIGCFVHYRCFVDAHSGEVLLSEFP